MKKGKLIKISVFILTLSLCLCAVFAMSANAADAQTTKPEIISQNVRYTDQFCLMFAVDSSAISPITLNVYRAVPNEETPCENSYVVSSATPGSVSGLGKDAYIFTVQGVGATKLDTEFYVQAVDAKGNKSDLLRYSVVEYLYERLASERSTEAQKEFYNDTLAFGAAAQLLFAEEGTTPELITSLSYVTVDGGTVNDFINESGVYRIGDTITLRTPNAISSTWKVTTTSADGAKTTATVTDKYVVVDAVKTEFELVSKKAHRSEVITFEDKTDGTSDTTYFSKESGTVCQYVYEEGRGMVLKATMSKANAGIYTKNIDTSIASKEEATAFEFSFDIKMNFDPLNTASRQYIIPAVRFDGASKRITRIGMGHNPNKTNFGFVNPKSGNEIQAIPDVDYSDWFHVRIVYYEGDTNGYVYINGTDTPFVLPYSGGGGSSGYTGDISLIDRVDFLIENTDSLSTIYIDNVFCGFTKDTIQTVE